MLLTLPTLSVALLASSLATSAIEPFAPLPSLASLASPIQTSALVDRNFSYNYFEGGLSVGDATGFELGGSTELEGPWIGVGRLLYLNDEESGLDIDFVSLSGGAGFVHPLQERLDLVATAELEYAKVDVESSGDDSEFGLRLLGGARFAATEEVELFGAIIYQSIFDADFSFNVGGRYQVNERWSALARVDVGDDLTQFLFGARYGF